MTPRDRVLTDSADTPALEVLHQLGANRLNQVPVLEEGRMIGLITRRELLERVELAESLGERRPD
jgi:CBS domain-containing protein